MVPVSLAPAFGKVRSEQSISIYLDITHLNGYLWQWKLSASQPLKKDITK